MDRDKKGTKRKHSPEEPRTGVGSTGKIRVQAGPCVSEPPNAKDVASADHTPRDVNVIAFAEKRSREIRTLLDSLSAKRTNKRLFQQLPRHMRRRAMSYNIKRLPTNMRGFAEKETSKAKTPKRPRKKYRKRPKNKKLAYSKRQNVNKWLETHVWHAKRFHMTTKWGYKLADFPNDKGFRAVYRASSEQCLMTDMSYLICMELEGPEADLLQGIQKLTCGEIGRTFAYKDYVDGHLEGSCLLYEHDRYPLGVIGLVRFLWVPKSHSSSPSRNLLLWMHPSIYVLGVKQLISAFRMDPVGEDVEMITVGNVPSIFAIKDEKLEELEPAGDLTIDEKVGALPILLGAKELKMEESVAMEGNKEMLSPVPIVVDDACTEFRSDSVFLRILKDQLVRLRLTGPRSTSVLKSVLKSAVLSPAGSGKDFWWETYFDNRTALELAKKQHQAWTGIASSPSSLEVRYGSTLAIVVRDPRNFLPRRKWTSREIRSDESESCSILPDRHAPLAFSPLWDSELRTRVKNEKKTDHEMNSLRAKLSAPGMQLDLGLEDARIPVVLIRNSGYEQEQGFSKNGYGNGWDLILPAGWAMSFWIPLVYNGARVGGLKELDTVALHGSFMRFPTDFPDADAGISCALERRKELEEKFQRYPPNKRPNYIKLGIVSPFVCPWNALVKNWIEIVKDDPHLSIFWNNAVTLPDSFCVVRNIRLLVLLRNVLYGKLSLIKFLVDESSIIRQHLHGLVPVFLLFSSGGVAEQFGTISVPTVEDYDKLVKEKGFKGPVEPNHQDPFGKNPVKERRKLQVAKILSNPDAVASHCSRKVFGYVIKGGYSLVRGREVAVGYCTLLGILSFVNNVSQSRRAHPENVLVRQPHSLQYQFVEVSIHMTPSVL